MAIYGNYYGYGYNSYQYGRGSAGSAGSAGSTGFTGSTGSTGSTGFTGSTGSAGSVGLSNLLDREAYGTWGYGKYSIELGKWQVKKKNLKYYKEYYDRYLEILKEAREMATRNVKTFDNIDDQILKYSNKCKGYENAMKTTIEEMNVIRSSAETAGVKRSILDLQMGYQNKSWDAWE